MPCYDPRDGAVDNANVSYLSARLDAMAAQAEARRLALVAKVAVHLSMAHGDDDMDQWVGLGAADKENDDIVSTMVTLFVALPAEWRRAALERLVKCAPKMFKSVAAATK